jgi:secreted PhoX family phosphatase
MGKARIQDMTLHSENETFAEVLQQRWSRRGFLKGALASVPLVIVGPSLLTRDTATAAEGDCTLAFQPIPLSSSDMVTVPLEYSFQTEIDITGPAAGHDRLRVSYDPTGTKVRGTPSNCAGGKSPWGTLLTCEENFHLSFANLNALTQGDPWQAIHTRYGLTAGASAGRWPLFRRTTVSLPCR